MTPQMLVLAVPLLALAACSSSGSSPAAQSSAAPVTLTPHQRCVSQMAGAVDGFTRGVDERSINGSSDPFYLPIFRLNASFQANVASAGLKAANRQLIMDIESWCAENDDPQRANVDDNGVYIP